MPYQEKIVAAGNVGNIINFTSPLKLFDYISLRKNNYFIACKRFLKEILREKQECYLY